ADTESAGVELFVGLVVYVFAAGPAPVGCALSLRDALPISAAGGVVGRHRRGRVVEHRHLRVGGARGHLDVAGLVEGPRVEGVGALGGARVSKAVTSFPPRAAAAGDVDGGARALHPELDLVE